MRTLPGPRTLVLASLVLLAACGGGSGGGGGNQAPVVTFSVGPRLNVQSEHSSTFTVTVSDPDGDAVSLRLLNPPAGLAFAPIVNQPSPQTRVVRWIPKTFIVPTERLLFSARDDAGASLETRAALDVHVEDDFNSRHRRADVTGDGIPDLVGIASGADVSGVVDAGAIYVWDGKATPAGTPFPLATLRVPGAFGADSLGVHGLLLEDVTGDGVPDVVAATAKADVGAVLNVGAIYVWKGGPTLVGALAPTATLTMPGAVASDQLTDFSLEDARCLYVEDVSGDGIGDLVAVARFADVGGIADAGAVYVWRGGAALVGAVAPSATLTPPGATSNDRLGDVSSTTDERVLFGDVTGDGVLDLVIVCGRFDVAGAASAGAVFVWRGGATLTGVAAPFATLTVAGSPAGAGLGKPTLGDVSGDGTLDVLVMRFASVSSPTQAGAAFLWLGGAGLAGTPAPAATLSVPGLAPTASFGGNALLAEVTGDAFLDVVCAADQADVAGAVAAGTLYVWEGGPTLTGAVPPTATLTALQPKDDDAIGRDGHIVFADVSGDGVLDVISDATHAEISFVPSAGATYVWEGGAGLVGSVVATSRMAAPAPVSFDQLALAKIADLTGDGTLDVVMAAGTVDVGGVVDAGAAFLWKGGPTLTGTPAPTATLTAPSPVASDQLGGGFSLGTLIGVADVSGDGIQDLVVAAPNRDVAGVVDAGAMFVWLGGAGLAGAAAPSATLVIAGAVTGDQLGGTSFVRDQGFELLDVTGDGIADLVVSAPRADVGGVANTGAIHVWRGGGSLSGTPTPTATLSVPGAVANDGLASGVGRSVILGDVTGDGIADVLPLTASADVGGVLDAGAMYIWKGGAGLVGSLPPSATLVAPGAITGDRLGQ